jgi:DNA-directed RNA polymerase subunit RPC12/RpoP
LRWGDRPFCPHCGSVRKPYFLNPENGASRKTRTGSASQRRVWKCADCRKQFSVLTGTINIDFHDDSHGFVRCNIPHAPTRTARML